MSIVKSIFGKDLYELELQDLQLFFQSEQEENAVLEFKSGETTYESIHKEVVAFLNTEGGVLIIGAPREIAGGDKSRPKICKGILMPSKSIKNQDTLMRSLASNIAPSPVNIKCKSMEADGGMIFILEVSQSQTPPHQVSDKGAYYIRLEREAKSAPHGIVEALFQKRQKPNLVAKIGFRKKLVNSIANIIIEASLENDSLITAESIGINIDIWGVHKILHQSGIMGDLAVKNEMIEYSNQDRGSILVKGMFMKQTIELTPVYPALFISYTFYCLHGQAEWKACIIDDQITILESIDSKDLLIERSRSDIYKNFKKKVVGEISKLLLVEPVPLDKRPSDVDGFFQWYNGLELVLPDGYLDFLLEFDGFKGILREINVDLFNRDTLMEQEPFELSHKLILLVIGKFGSISIVLASDEGQQSFGYLHATNSRNGYVKQTESFYLLLKNWLA